LTDPKIAELVARETGARTAVLDPLEGLDEAGRAAGLDYLQIMRSNVDNLKKALNE
jgi:zinc transport system substrate-binding protein